MWGLHVRVGCVGVDVCVLTGDILLLGCSPPVQAVQADGAAVVHGLVLLRQDGLLIPEAGGQPSQLPPEDSATSDQH